MPTSRSIESLVREMLADLSGLVADGYKLTAIEGPRKLRTLASSLAFIVFASSALGGAFLQVVNALTTAIIHPHDVEIWAPPLTGGLVACLVIAIGGSIMFRNNRRAKNRPETQTEC